MYYVCVCVYSVRDSCCYLPFTDEEAISLRQKLESNLLFAKSALDCNHGNKTKRKSEPEPLLRKPSPPQSAENGTHNVR